MVVKYNVKTMMSLSIGRSPDSRVGRHLRPTRGLLSLPKVPAFLQVLFLMQCGREVQGGSYWILFGQIDKFSYWFFVSKEKA